MDYPYIRAWGKLMGSMPYWVEAQVEKARETKAPEDAIFDRNGEWHTFRDIKSEDTQAEVEAYANQFKEEKNRAR